jgi:hypothetical protein
LEEREIPSRRTWRDPLQADVDEREIAFGATPTR